MNQRIKLVNNDQEKKFEIWVGNTMKVSLTPGQFSMLMMEIKKFIEERNPERTKHIRERRQRKIRRAIFWITLREKIREFFKKLFI